MKMIQDSALACYNGVRGMALKVGQHVQRNGKTYALRRWKNSVCKAVQKLEGKPKAAAGRRLGDDCCGVKEGEMIKQLTGAAHLRIVWTSKPERFS
jgi:hypothetical protein